MGGDGTHSQLAVALKRCPRQAVATLTPRQGSFAPVHALFPAACEDLHCASCPPRRPGCRSEQAGLIVAGMEHKFQGRRANRG